jgi:hypothetical protein
MSGAGGCAFHDADYFVRHVVRLDDEDRRSPTFDTFPKRICLNSVAVSRKPTKAASCKINRANTLARKFVDIPAAFVYIFQPKKFGLRNVSLREQTEEEISGV